MTQLKTEAVFFTLSWMQEALKWQLVTAKACGMVLTSLIQLFFSHWSSSQMLKIHLFMHVSVFLSGRSRINLGLNQTIYTWKCALQLNGNICSAKKARRGRQSIVLVDEQVQSPVEKSEDKNILINT